MANIVNSTIELRQRITGQRRLVTVGQPVYVERLGKRLFSGLDLDGTIYFEDRNGNPAGGVNPKVNRVWAM